jgi:glycosyltransferase involved in cell wall biosynthesis
MKEPSLEAWRSYVEGRHYVWLLAPPWDNVPTRQKHFATRLARLGAKVLYVENPPALSGVIKQRRWDQLPFRLAAKVREVEPGLQVMSPAGSLPGMRHWESVAAWNGKRISRQVNSWLRERGTPSFTAWCRVPACIYPLRHLDPALTVYDVTDDYELYEPDDARARARVHERERALIAKSGQVFITAEELRQKPAIAAANPVLAPNGVDVGLFAQATDGGLIHPSLRGIGKPLIGYVGLTSHWMDFELLETLGRRWPGQVVMVGPIAAQVEARARAIPGIIWAGFVPQPELPPYLRAFAVTIMPHLVNELRRRSNPLKVCESLATGKPFVTVDLPAVQPYRSVIDIALDREDFVRRVAANLHAPPDPAMTARRRAMAQAFSWDRIFEGILNQLHPPLRAVA